VSFAAVPLARSYGYDTDTKLTTGSASVLRRAPYPGTPSGQIRQVLFLFRYVPLSGVSLGDITVAERDVILGAGWLLGLVQHVLRPSWQADATMGTQHALAAVQAAQAVGYPAGCALGLDMEGLGDSGAPVEAYVQGWSTVVRAGGYKTLLYVGYDDGLTAAQTLAIADYVDAWWSDFGPRSLPPPLQFSLKQSAQTTVAGIGVDPDQCLRDGTICLMGSVPDNDMDEDPATLVTSDHAA
jgi:Domain of unknown function (DUF1906)